MFPGIKVAIGDKEFVVPALTLGQLRSGLLAKLQQNDELIKAGKPWEATMLQGEIVYEALKRNYPEMTLEATMDLLDVVSTGTAFLAVLGASGFPSGATVPATEPAKEVTGTSAPSTQA